MVLMKLRRWIVAFAGFAVIGLAARADAQEDNPRRGWLGISYVATEDNGDETVVVESVYPGSPAAAAGMRAGDVIIRWNGSTDVSAALEALRLRPGDEVRLTIRRGRARDRDVLVTAGQRPREFAYSVPKEGPGVFGMSPDEWETWQKELRENGEEIARLFRDNPGMRALRADSLGRVWQQRFKLDSLALHADSLHKGIELMLRDSLGPQLQALGDQIRIMVPEGTSRTVIALGRRSVAGAEFEEMNEGLSRYFGTDEGALVLRVSPETPAARAGLQPGDVVLEVDEREVDSVDDIRDAVSRAQRSRSRAVQMEILREGRRRELDLSWE
jgi:membrane-associated protease RseP (regulator of RpoE activity)